jgi:hypothetical protein
MGKKNRVHGKEVTGCFGINSELTRQGTAQPHNKEIQTTHIHK